MDSKIDLTLKAIADSTRREILDRLLNEKDEIGITKLSESFDISRQGVTKHLHKLEEAGLVKIKVNGRERYCVPNPKPLQEIKKWLTTYEKFWDRSLDSLQKHLGER